MLANIATTLIKVLGSIIAGVGAGLLAVGIFALRKPEPWESPVFNRYGPPLGPTTLAVGVGLLTAMVLLVVLFWRSWRRMAREGFFLRGSLIKVLASLIGGAGTGFVVFGGLTLQRPEPWEHEKQSAKVKSDLAEKQKYIREWTAALSNPLSQLTPEQRNLGPTYIMNAQAEMEQLEQGAPRATSLVGPVLLACGIGFLSAAFLMAILFWCSGRRHSSPSDLTVIDTVIVKEDAPEPAPPGPARNDIAMDAGFDMKKPQSVE